MMLYSALAQGKVDFSQGKVHHELSQGQTDYLMQMLLRAANPGEIGKRLRTMLRRIQLAEAAHILRARSVSIGHSKPWSRIDEEIAAHYRRQGYTIEARTVKEARVSTRKVLESICRTNESLDAYELPHIDLNRLSDSF